MKVERVVSAATAYAEPYILAMREVVAGHTVRTRVRVVDEQSVADEQSKQRAALRGKE